MPWAFPGEFVLVVDASRGRQLLHLPCQHGASVLTEDARALIVTQADPVTEEIHGHRAYDLPARPRWAWVVSVPAGVLGAVVGLRDLRRRRNEASRNRTRVA